jgi:hypothetical protein
MCHDRVDDDVLPLTHDFLSLMLGVRRSGVTEALHVLEGVEIMKAGRGVITVLNEARRGEPLDLEDEAVHHQGIS